MAEKQDGNYEVYVDDARIYVLHAGAEPVDDADLWDGAVLIIDRELRALNKNRF